MIQPLVRFKPIQDIITLFQIEALYGIEPGLEILAGVRPKAHR